MSDHWLESAVTTLHIPDLSHVLRRLLLHNRGTRGTAFLLRHRLLLDHKRPHELAHEYTGGQLDVSILGRGKCQISRVLGREAKVDQWYDRLVDHRAYSVHRLPRFPCHTHDQVAMQVQLVW